jgi:hypothetical protein
MARLAIPNNWAGALVRQRGPLRTYQWLWLLLCAAGALIAAAPRILSQPVVYTSTAAITFDPRRYGGLLTQGRINGEYQAVERIAIELLQASQDGETPRYVGLGSPTLGVRYEPQPDGGVRVVAVGRSPAQAQRLADSKGRTFRQVAEEFLHHKEAGWRNATHRQQWRSTLRTYAEPVIGSLPIGAITTEHVLQILQPMWLATPETGARSPFPSRERVWSWPQ